jgi:hypothetical protein
MVWGDLASLYSGPVILRSIDGDIDMKATRELLLTNPDMAGAFIYATGPRPGSSMPDVLATRNVTTTSSSAHLSALIYPNGFGGNAWFEWGTSALYGNTTPEQAVPSSPASFEIATDLTGLSPSTQYHFRPVFHSSAGDVFGIDQTVTTQSATAVDGGDDLPRDVVLYRSYPNPFNPGTQISYYLPRSVRAILKVFDLTGRELLTLVDGIESPGMHSVAFDAATFPSGMYICRLWAGNASLTQKLVLVK